VQGEIFESVKYVILYVVATWAVAGLVCGSFSSWLAGRKGYSRLIWFFLGFGFNLIALVTLVGAPSKDIGSSDSSSVSNQIQVMYEALSADNERLLKAIKSEK